MSSNMYALRVERVRAQLHSAGCGQMLVTDPMSIFYLTGAQLRCGERLLALYISDTCDPKLFVNKLYPLAEAAEAEKIWYRDGEDPTLLIAEAVDRRGVLGVDKKMVSQFLLPLQERGAAAAYQNTSWCVDQVRARKEPAECEKMRAASRLNDLAMEEMKKLVRPGITEREISREIPGIYRSLGADGVSFNPIVSFGKNAADPHHHGDDTVLREGDCVLFDVGCKKDDYCSDMTRTFFWKEVSREQETIYQLVLQANLAAEAAVRVGSRFCDVDFAGRAVIEKGGYGAQFTHRLGHSIGLETHEAGDVSAANGDPLQVGNVFSCEPGIYVEGQMGVRIEDLCLVTQDGAEVLNRYPKALEVLG